MKEIIHFIRYDSPQRQIVCRDQAVGLPAGTTRVVGYKIFGTSTIPEIRFTPDAEKVTCPECLEICRAEETKDFVKQQNVDSWAFYMKRASGQHLDHLMSVFGLVRNPRETDNAFRTRAKREVR